jgi:hypothetical protein
VRRSRAVIVGSPTAEGSWKAETAIVSGSRQPAEAEEEVEGGGWTVLDDTASTSISYGACVSVSAFLCNVVVVVFAVCPAAALAVSDIIVYSG